MGSCRWLEQVQVEHLLDDKQIWRGFVTEMGQDVTGEVCVCVCMLLYICCDEQFHTVHYIA